MKIAFNPSTVGALIAPPNNKDITFDLRGHNIFARGVKFCGTDTNTWRDIKINNVSIDSNILDLRDGDNTTLTNINGVVAINSTWRPVVDNLTSDSTTSSLSANQGRVLKALIDDKSDSGHTHDDRYLKLTGGWMSGDINFGGDNKICWGRNTDSASISFKNDGDGDTDSYMSFVTSDNGNEYFRWSHSSGSTNTEWMALRSDGLRVGGTKVSLEGHSHNDLYYTKTEVNNKLNGKSDTSHTHDDRYLKLTGGTMSGTIYRNSGGATISGRDNAIIRQTYAPGGSSWNPIACVDTETGTWTLGHLSSGDSDTNFHFCFSTNTDYNAGNNNGNYVTLRNKVGTIALLSEIPDKNSWNYDDRYLKLTGGTMNGNARIGHGSGNLYIGNSGNDGWLAVQDICSQDSIGDGKWSIRVDGTASFQSIKFPSNRLIAQVSSGSNSPLKGIKLPDLQSNGIGIFSRVGNDTDEGGIILSEDTCVIYNSFDTGWGLSVRDKDINQTDISGDNTIAFGIRQDYRAYSLGGFEKSGSDNSYVLLGGGGHKAENALNVSNADTVDGEHASAFTRIIGRNSIITTGTAPYNYIHLFRIANSNSYSTLDCEIDFRTRYHSAKIEIRIATNKPQYGVGNSSISIVKKVINGRSCNFWVLQTVQSSNYNYYDVYYESGAWNGGSYGIIFKGSNGVLVFEHKGINLESLPDKVIPVSNNVATSATKLQTPRKIWGQSFDGTGDVSGSLSNTGTITASTAATYDIGSNALDYRYGYFQWIGAKSNTNLRLAANNSDNQIVLHTNGNVGVGTNGPTEKLTVNGWIGTNGIYTNRTGSSTDGGVSLYSNVDPMTYGIAFRGTGTYGTHGYVTSASDWATYLTMNDSTTRGWIFRRGDTNVASIAGSGNMAIGQHLEFSNGAHISTNRSTDYHYGYTFNLGDNTKSIGMYSGPVEEAGGVVISPDGCLIYNSSDCGYNLQVRDKDLGSDLTNIATLTFGIEQSGYYAWSRGGFKKNGSSDSYVLLGGGGHSKITDLSVANADTVDGYHANGLLTALSNSDNGISITVGGTTKSVSNISVNYANNADTLDGYHENSFLRYRGATGTDQEATLWDQIGIKQYNNALPDNLTDVYNYGSVISLPGYSSRFEIYASHLSSSGNGLYYRSGWGSDKRSWLKFIDSSNIGSQSVKYASSAGNADTVDGYHANSFLIDRGGDYKGLLYDLPCKSIFSGYNPSDAPTTGWVSGIVLGSNWNSSHFQHYLVEIGSRWYTTRIYSNSKMTNWNTFAYLTDNVASATKLATARTIWGQSFDGTGDIPINVAAKMPYVLFKRFDNNENAGYVGCGSSSNNNIYISSYTNANIILDGNNIGIGTYSPTYKLDVNGQVRASGFRHSSVNSDNYVLLAGGGYSQGVPVRYWAIYQMQIGNSSSWCRYFKDSGNYDFITAVTWKETGVAVVQLKFPPGYSINNTLIFGNGENKYSGNWKLPVYVSISITNFSYNDEIGVKIADNDTPSTGDARIYFMCMG